ncbi:unnamed protein product [Xylocopa violacea]|uniref:Uncharacterized protein n=1 Tax=Xylocopa violacea TaxID=135666 RepID=A0ABP1NIA2_XYLVO
MDKSGSTSSTSNNDSPIACNSPHTVSLYHNIKVRLEDILKSVHEVDTNLKNIENQLFTTDKLLHEIQKETAPRSNVK